MASIRKRSNAWQVRIQRNGYPDQSKSFKTRAEGLAWARKVESEIDIGINSHQCEVSYDIPLRELLNKYKKEVTSRKKHSSVESYRVNAWLRHPLASIPVSSIRSSDIAKWREERIKLGRSANTIRLELSVLSNLFNVAMTEWGYERLNNPTTKVKIPKLPAGRTRRVTQEEFELIIQNSDSSYLEPIVTLALETGMRRGEIVAIEWKNLSASKRTIYIPFTKNDEAREIPLSPKALNLLDSMRDNLDGRIFNITAHAISVAFSRACKRANITNLHFHDLRHEAITRFFEKGLTIAEVATISGHKTWTMLRRYTHLSAANIAKKLC